MGKHGKASCEKNRSIKKEVVVDEIDDERRDSEAPDGDGSCTECQGL
jgi:hypothetical protein